MSQIKLTPNLLTKLREQAGFRSVYDIAKVARVPNEFLRKVEAGQSSIILTGGTAKAYCEVLNIPPTLFGFLAKCHPLAYPTYWYLRLTRKTRKEEK